MKYSRFFFPKARKHFSFHFNRKGCRNFLVRICVFHRGGANFTNYSFIDFSRCINSFGYLLKIFKELSRSALIGTILYFNGLVSNFILPEGVNVGALLFSGQNSLVKKALGPGYTLPLGLLPLFSLFYNVALTPRGKGKYARAAGTSAFCISSTAKHCQLKLLSGWQVLASNLALASFGQASNSFHKYIALKKAGANRRLGFRPTVR